MKRAASGGFTIVESMVVLGVTGVLFVSLVGMVAGQQSKARFKASMTDITTQIQSQINEVATGFYSTADTFRCTAVGGNLFVSGQVTEQGTNAGCTFLGRAMMYGIPGTDPEEYDIQTLVGLQRNAAGQEPKTMQEAGTRVLDRGLVYNSTAPWPNSLTTTKTLQYGTEIAWMRSDNGAQPGQERIVGIAIVSAPNQQIAYDQNGSTESGTVIPSIIPIPYSGPAGGTGGVSRAQGVDLITRSLGVTANAIAADASDGPVEICFKSGTTNQSGLVTIGRNNSTTSIEMNIFNTLDCS